MSVSSFETLPNDVLYEIFGFLSTVDILQSLFLLSKRLSRIILNKYLWHFHIGDKAMSLMMFTDRSVPKYLEINRRSDCFTTRNIHWCYWWIVIHFVFSSISSNNIASTSAFN